MQLRTAVFLAAALLCASIAAVPPAALGASPYEIDVIVSLTGSAALSGSQEAQSLAVLENVVNTSGGIAGRPIKFVVADDQSSPQVAVQIATSVIAKKVAVLLGASLTTTCNAIAPLLVKTGPVQYCFAPGMNPPTGGYAFTASVGARDLVALACRYFRERGWLRLGMLMATDATGQELDRQFAAVLARPENQALHVVAHEHFNVNDISATAQLARIKAQAPQVLVVWAIGTPFGTALHGMRDVGLDVPVLASAGDMTYEQMEQYAGFLPKAIYFPRSGAATLGGLSDDPAVRRAQLRYFTALQAAHIRPSYPNGLSWDPAMIVVDALRHLGPQASPRRLRDYIANLHGWAGIDGIYDFRTGDQRGLGENAALLYTWDPSKKEFIAATKQGGRPRDDTQHR
jgi:branched-chain amino acid transport system substrate-binding protein